jgi:hypothetical protein
MQQGLGLQCSVSSRWNVVVSTQHEAKRFETLQQGSDSPGFGFNTNNMDGPQEVCLHVRALLHALSAPDKS